LTLPFSLSKDEDALLPDADPAVVATQAESTNLPDQEAFDFSSAMAIVDGDMDLLREIATLFLDDCHQKIDQIREGIRAGDAGTVEAAAHSLKGAAGSIGAKQLEQRFLHLEMAGADSAKLATTAEKAGILQESEIDLAELEQEMDTFKEALKEREVILGD